MIFQLHTYVFEIVINSACILYTEYGVDFGSLIRQDGFYGRLV
jgi:imidazoleglycerol phosphate synthase glutamine amidotransferase subunit HisH